MKLSLMILVAMLMSGAGMALHQAAPVSSERATSPIAIAAGPAATSAPQPTPRPASTNAHFIPRNLTDPPRIPLDIEPVDGMFVYLDEHFDEIYYARDGVSTVPFFTGDLGYGASAIDDGALHLYPNANDWFWLYPLTPGALPNGVIQTRVSVDPDGYAGVVGRASKYVGGLHANETVGLYACLVSHWGDAGCYAYADNRWTILFEYTSSAIFPRDAYTLTLTVVDSTLELRVDDRIVGTATDTTRTTGSWGLYAQGTETARSHASFDYVTIATPPEGYTLD